MDTNPVSDLIDEAIKIAGGTQEKLGALLGVSQNAVHAARKAGRVSAELATKIEVATKRKIRRSQLRPDIFPPRGKNAGSA